MTFAGLNYGCFELSTYFSKGRAKKKNEKRIPDFIALLKLVVDAEKQQRLDELYAKYLKRETSKDELFSGIRRIAGNRTTSTVFSLMDDTSNQELSVDQKLALYKLLGVDNGKLKGSLDQNTALEGNRILRECLAIIGEGVPLNDELLLKACKQLKFRETAARNWIKALQHYKLVHETTVNLRELDLNDKSVN